jgi:hypothetical protein
MEDFFLWWCLVLLGGILGWMARGLFNGHGDETQG